LATPDFCRKLRKLSTSGPGCGGWHHNGTCSFPGPRIGQPDDGNLGYAGVAGEDVLDLFGCDVLAVADDDVLGPPGDDEVLIVDPAGEIPGAKVTLGIEGFGFILRMLVANQHLRPAGVDFAGLVAADELDVSQARVAVSVGGVVGVLQTPDRRHRTSVEP